MTRHFFNYQLVLICTLLAPIVLSQEKDELFDLSLTQLLELEVSVAARKKEPWLTSSGTVYVVHRNDIENYGWRDLKEILASIPNMDYFYQWSWLPGGQRGFTGNMSGTLLLIDGREVQNLLANEAFIMNNFPASRIERVEVLQGPNSTLYGGNAAQGVINLVTRLHQDENEISALAGEADTRHANLLLNHKAGDFRFALNASYFSSAQDYSELREFLSGDEGFSRNLSRDPLREHNPNRIRNDENNFTLDVHLSHPVFYLGTNISRAENVSGIEAVTFDYYTGDDSRRGYYHYYVGNKATPFTNWQVNTELNYFREYKEKDRLQTIIPDDAQSFDDLTLFNEQEDIGPSDRIRFKTQWQYQASEDQDWVFGYDAWRTHIGRKIKYRQTDDGVVLFTPDAWPEDKEKSDKHALYSQFSQAWNWQQQSLKLSMGLRYNKQDFTNSAWLPRMSLVYQTSAHQAFKLTYGRAFRPPSIFEFDLVIDDTIESQTMEMQELNWSRMWRGSGFEVTNSASVYHMQAKNFYQKILDPEDGIWRTLVNGEQSVSGVENQLQWHTNRWEGQLGLRYVNPDKTQVGQRSEVLNIPKYKIKFGLVYHFNQAWRIAGFVDHWASNYTEANRFEMEGTEIIKIPSWSTLNFNLFRKGRDFSYGLYIENLFDKTYYHGNARGTSPIRYIQPPRNLRLYVKYHF